MIEKIKTNYPLAHKYLFTVTTLSKLLALFLFVLFPIVGFYMGMQYQQALNSTYVNLQSENNSIQKKQTYIPKVTATPSPVKIVESKTTDSTTGWTLYKNSTYGFSVEYPQNWSVVSSNNPNFLKILNEINLEYSLSFYHPLPSGGDRVSGGLNVYDTSLENAINSSNSYEVKLAIPRYPVSEENISLNGTNGKLIVYADKNKQYVSYSYFLENNGKSFIISWSEVSEYGYTNIGKSIINTFKFTK